MHPPGNIITSRFDRVPDVLAHEPIHIHFSILPQKLGLGGELSMVLNLLAVNKGYSFFQNPFLIKLLEKKGTIGVHTRPSTFFTGFYYLPLLVYIPEIKRSTQ